MARALVVALHGWPALQPLWDEVQTWLEAQTHRGPEATLGPAPQGRGLFLGLRAWTAPTSAAPRELELDVVLPERVRVGRRAPVSVSLAELAGRDSAVAQVLELVPGEALTLLLLSDSRGLRVLEPREHTVPVPAQGSGDPVVFFVQPERAGTHTMTLVVLRQNQRLAESTFGLLAEAPEAGDPGQTPRVLWLPTPREPVDMELWVRWRGDTLRFTVHSPSGRAPAMGLEVGAVQLRQDLATWQREQRKRMEGWLYHTQDGARRLHADATQTLLREGGNLWAELWPPALQRWYERYHGAISSILIVSDESVIPWELLRPHNHDGQHGKLPDVGEPLGLAHNVGRWFSGATSPPGYLEVHALAAVAVAQSGTHAALPGTQQERALLAALAGRKGLRDLSPEPPTASAVRALLGETLTANQAQLLHFSTHGSVGEHPEDVGLLLAGGERLRAAELEGALAAAQRQARALVVLSACHGGVGPLGLWGTEGWAHRWVGRCGATALIGPMWPVHDPLGPAFTGELLRALEAGERLGEALRLTRRHLARDPRFPDHLAYVLYGHPNARVAFAPGRP